ncbi:MAG: efflux RND transporter periplasmic adaptor subunit [Gammaproteobacteria bacterium]|nr:efflux RND transporter periplasmic adaptor subunit [Gammaproteobacteria bacterium]
MRNGVAFALGLGVIAVLGWWILGRTPSGEGRSGPAIAAETAAPGGPAGRRGRRGGPGDFDGPVPVAIGAVARRDVPIFLDGLGTVQAFNTVTVRPQVSGQLVSVAFEEGQEVKKGELLAQIDPRSFDAQLQQALAQKGQAEAQLNTARRDLQRFRELVGDGYVSKQQLDTQAQTVAQLEAGVKASEAAVQNARISQGFARVTAPISGITGLRLVDVGNLVDAGTSGGLVVVTQIRPISVLFTLPEQSLGDIRAAGGQGLEVLAYDRDNARKLAKGELTVIDNQIDQSTGTIRLKATFANDDKALWPGQFVNMRLLVRTEADGLVIPANAVQRGPDGDFVYVVGQDSQGQPVAEKRDITVARSEAGTALIASGLKNGERIVTDGQYRLQPGAKIRETRDEPVAADAPPQRK